MANRKMRAKPDTRLAGDAAVGSHAYKRMDRMTLMGLTLPKLVQLGKIAPPWRLACQAASTQAGRGSAAGGTQAAHNLPRDLLLNGRPVWTYAHAPELMGANARIKLQVDYAAAATVTVPREANYIDSRWEETSLVDRWLAYLTSCLTAVNGAPAAGLLPAGARAAAVAFKQDCHSTFAATMRRILDSDYYDAHAPALEAYFALYGDRINRYDPVARLDTLWRIYQRPPYA